MGGHGRSREVTWSLLLWQRPVQCAARSSEQLTCTRTTLACQLEEVSLSTVPCTTWPCGRVVGAAAWIHGDATSATHGSRSLHRGAAHVRWREVAAVFAVHLHAVGSAAHSAAASVQRCVRWRRGGGGGGGAAVGGGGSRAGR